MRYWIVFACLLIVGLSACGDYSEHETLNVAQGDGDSDADGDGDGESDADNDGDGDSDESDCSDGVVSICEDGAIRDCASDATQPCHGGECITDGDRALCVASSGSRCRGRTSDGEIYQILCGDDDGVADDLICDLRSDECRPASFDCGALTGVGTDQLYCDSTGNFLSGCHDGQPVGLVCEGDSSCGSDDTFNCYAEAQAGASCGGPVVCAPGYHCRQSGPGQSTCSQPAGQLACSSSDVLSICLSDGTGLACVEGDIFWWEELPSWGGSCDNDRPVIPEGGTCIPGLADCAAGFACDASPYDIAGVCRTPDPDAPAECTLTDQGTTGNSCLYRWDSCADGNQYNVTCQAQSAAGHIITTCRCYINGSETRGGFEGGDLCGVESIEELDQLAQEKCEWDVVTVDVTP